MIQLYFLTVGEKRRISRRRRRECIRFLPRKMRACAPVSIKPQMTPEARVREIRSFLSELTGLTYSGREFTLEGELLTRERSIFSSA